MTLEPFRAVLIEVSRTADAYPMLTGCSYEVLKEQDGVPQRVKFLSSDGRIGKLSALRETEVTVAREHTLWRSWTAG